MSLSLYFLTQPDEKFRQIAINTPPVDNLFNIQHILDYLGLQYVALMMNDDQIIGYSIIGRNGTIDMVEIHPYYQGQGLCSILMTFVFGKLRDLGFSKVNLYNVGGEPALRCYMRGAEANGYTVESSGNNITFNEYTSY